MAGRGCTIHIKVLGGTEIAEHSEELSLPVALHSPLEILRTEIERLTNILVGEQVLILCDFSDPERNSDVLLTGRDHMSLRECGIRNNSILTLHALGISAERRIHLMKEAFKAKDSGVVKDPKTITLKTNITPSQANHSYNGIIFDMEVKGPHEVTVTSISLGGMLGPVRIYARDRPWNVDNDDEPSPHWWAHRDSLSTRGWVCVASVNCLPSWDKPCEVTFKVPFTMQPHSKHGFYCHSSLPDDLGIQYQSYSKEDVVAEDDFITVLPGLGHTGSEPFDHYHGWYRAWRGPAGIFTYMVRRKGWSHVQHKLFPSELKQAVFTMLLCHNTRAAVGIRKSIEGSGSGRGSDKSESQMALMKCSKSVKSGVKCSEECRQIIDLFCIPKEVLLNLLQFMHWDWFEEVESKRRVQARVSLSTRAAYAALSRAAASATVRTVESGGGSGVMSTVAMSTRRTLAALGARLFGLTQGQLDVGGTGGTLVQPANAGIVDTLDDDEMEDEAEIGSDFNEEDCEEDENEDDDGEDEEDCACEDDVDDDDDDDAGDRDDYGDEGNEVEDGEDGGDEVGTDVKDRDWNDDDDDDDKAGDAESEGEYFDSENVNGEEVDNSDEDASEGSVYEGEDRENCSVDNSNSDCGNDETDA